MPSLENKEPILSAWKPSPARTGYIQRFNVSQFILSNDATLTAMYTARKEWAMKANGFRRRTHPEEYA